jgi:hypothetical protein
MDRQPRDSKGKFSRKPRDRKTGRYIGLNRGVEPAVQPQPLVPVEPEMIVPAVAAEIGPVPIEPVVPIEPEMIVQALVAEVHGPVQDNNEPVVQQLQPVVPVEPEVVVGHPIPLQGTSDGPDSTPVEEVDYEDDGYTTPSPLFGTPTEEQQVKLLERVNQLTAMGIAPTYVVSTSEKSEEDEQDVVASDDDGGPASSMPVVPQTSPPKAPQPSPQSQQASPHKPPRSPVSSTVSSTTSSPTTSCRTKSTPSYVSECNTPKCVAKRNDTTAHMQVDQQALFVSQKALVMLQQQVFDQLDSTRTKKRKIQSGTSSRHHLNLASSSLHTSTPMDESFYSDLVSPASINTPNQAKQNQHDIPSPEPHANQTPTCVQASDQEQSTLQQKASLSPPILSPDFIWASLPPRPSPPPSPSKSHK